MGIVPLAAEPARNRKETVWKCITGPATDPPASPRCILPAAPTPAIFNSSEQPARGGSVPASTILLIEADPAAGETISPVLSGVGYTVTTVADANDTFAKVPENQLIIIDVVEGDKSAADICREIRATPSLVAIPVLRVSQTDELEERIHFLEAGADDVMAKPFDARELE